MMAGMDMQKQQQKVRAKIEMYNNNSDTTKYRLLVSNPSGQVRWLGSRAAGRAKSLGERKMKMRDDIDEDDDDIVKAKGNDDDGFHSQLATPSTAPATTLASNCASMVLRNGSIMQNRMVVVIVLAIEWLVMVLLLPSMTRKMTKMMLLALIHYRNSATSGHGQG